MTKLIVGVDKGSYTFNPINKTISLTNFNTLSLENILLITNVTKNTIIYNFADSSLGATITNNIITLIGADTSAMSSNDDLQIFIEDGQDLAVQVLDALSNIVNPATEDSLFLLRTLVKNLESIANVDVNNRQRIAVESCVLSSGTITTVQNVTNAQSIGGIDARYMQMDIANSAYNSGFRANLSFS